MDPERYIYVISLIILFFIITFFKKVYEQIRNEDFYDSNLSESKEKKARALIPYNKGLFFFFNSLETYIMIVLLIVSIMTLNLYSIVVVIVVFMLKPPIQWLGKKYKKNVLSFSIHSVYALYKPFWKWTTPHLPMNKISKEIIENKITLGKQRDILDFNEYTMLINLLYFKEKTIRDVLKTPRTRMTGISIADSFEKVTEIIQTTKFSRFPVYKNNIDNVVGLLYAKDLFLLTEEQVEHFRVDMVMKPSMDLIYVLENKNVSDLFYEMKRCRTHVAIVIDEFGGTIGMITLEDILEAIVGDIGDEKDEHEEKFILEQFPSSLIVHAKIPLSILNEQFHTFIEHENVDTLGGFIIDYLGYIPVKGETIELENVTFHILSAEKNRICLVKVIRKKGVNEYE